MIIEPLAIFTLASATRPLCGFIFFPLHSNVLPYHFQISAGRF